MKWSDVRGLVWGSLYRYSGVWVFVGLTTVELGGVFKVEREGDGLSISAEYCG